MGQQMQKVTIPNFNLGMFRTLLDQSLIVNTQIMIEFNNELVKSCSFSQTKSFMKLWTIPMKSFIGKSEDGEGALNLDDDVEELNHIGTMPVFNFYILKGDLFRNYLSVHNSELVTLEFQLQEIENGKMQAATITIKGKSEIGSPLVTTFTLTTEELILNRVNDYGLIINECTPSKDMIDIILTNLQIQEIKRLVKKLHKSTVDNTSFLTFTISNGNVNIKDRVFDIDFPLTTIGKNMLGDTVLTFNILKTDFIMVGNHTFNIYTSEESQKVIYGTKFGGAMIWGLSTKISEGSAFDSDIDVNSVIDLDGMDDYEL